MSTEETAETAVRFVRVLEAEVLLESDFQVWCRIGREQIALPADYTIVERADDGSCAVVVPEGVAVELGLAYEVWEAVTSASG
jgi:hypothetical protein